MRVFGVGAAAVVLLLAGLLTTACTNTGRAVLSDGTEVKFTESEPKSSSPTGRSHRSARRPASWSTCPSAPASSS